MYANNLNNLISVKKCCKVKGMAN